MWSPPGKTDGEPNYYNVPSFSFNFLPESAIAKNYSNSISGEVGSN